MAAREQFCFFIASYFVRWAYNGQGDAGKKEDRSWRRESWLWWKQKNMPLAHVRASMFDKMLHAGGYCMSVTEINCFIYPDCLLQFNKSNQHTRSRFVKLIAVEEKKEARNSM